MKLFENSILTLFRKSKPLTRAQYFWAKLQSITYEERNEVTPVFQTTQATGPRRIELLLLRIMILAAVILLLFFVTLFFSGRIRGFYPLYVLLCVSLGYKLIKLLFEWYHYWAINVPLRPGNNRQWSVCMLTTAMPGEPYEMIEETLKAMVNVRYPHSSYLCDEGDDPRLKGLCQRLGVIHVTRLQKTNAKAGNINNALRQAPGDICVILDPDHAPLPQFLDEVLPYFNNPEIGFVQVPQVYKNASDTWIAQGAAQQTYSFYGPLMMGMNSYGTVQAIGANCSFRREALESIGGHAAGLSEDMHTAMRLHAGGWKSVYFPGILTRGLVPANIGAYYKQQLKWSRGVFELLLTVFPFLFRKFTWRQRLHYCLLPLHFAAGVIVLADILIPVMTLLTGEVPLRFNTNELLWLALAIICLVFLIRQYAQRWLLEKQERGFHFAGGILLFGVWWIYTVGLIYTFFRVKVPYIPTPKEDARTNNLKLHIPNIIICCICVWAIAYGLNRDWNPYNFIAAGLAAGTICMLGIVILASQQLFLLKIKNAIRRNTFLAGKVHFLRHSKDQILSSLYVVLQKKAPLLAAISICAIILMVTLTRNKGASMSALDQPISAKTGGGFYMGVYIPELQQKKSLKEIKDFKKALHSTVNIISIYEAWGPASLEQFPRGLLDSIAADGSIPMISWEPWVYSFPLQKKWPRLKQEKQAMAAIAAGVFDDYIRAYATKILVFDKPVFIRFAHEPDNPAYPWSATGENTAEDYKAAWRHIVEIFAEEAVSNVTWVWNPWSPATMDNYYPGDSYVDWAGITCLNYGAASGNGKWHSFEEIYAPYRKKLLSLNKPVMLAEFGSTNYGGPASTWFSHALLSIRENHPEIKSLTFFNSNKDKNWITSWRPSPGAVYIDWTISPTEPLLSSIAEFNHANPPLPSAAKHLLPAGINENKPVTHATMLKGAPGSFTLVASGKPFYIRGISYNAGPDWRDGDLPLSINTLRKDFASIKASWCNTIRRYHPSIYDRNILKTAEEFDLKLIYGFWFDPTVDYYKDSNQVKEYIRLVEKRVNQYKTNRSILAWCTGNQTSSALENYFAQPYLGRVKKAYIEMIETMARSVHQIDSLHPVLTALENNWRLPSELVAFHKDAPSVDILGVNSCMDRSPNNLVQLTSRFDAGRPYLVSEFGGRAYWDSKSTEPDGLPEEYNDLQKANLYSGQWNNKIVNNKGHNLGGIAFCWQDKFDGTATWFGITDFKGRKKAAYYALQKIWKGSLNAPVVPALFLVGPDFPLKPGANYAYTAVYNSPVFKKVEWRLMREDCTGEIHNLIQADKGNKIWISIPYDHGQYRLYVYLNDGNGNVVTASLPIAASKEIL